MSITLITVRTLIIVITLITLINAIILINVIIRLTLITLTTQGLLENLKDVESKIADFERNIKRQHDKVT